MLGGVVIQCLLHNSASHDLVEHALRDLAHTRRLAPVLAALLPELEVVGGIVVLRVSFFLAPDPVELARCRTMLSVLADDKMEPLLELGRVDRAQPLPVYV